MSSVVVSSPFLSPSESLRKLMMQVLLALVPGTVAYVWFFGFGVVVNIVLACFMAIAFEAGVLRLRNKPVKPHITDGSALVSAWLFALCLPMHSPWWLVLVGIGFTMIAGKHLYGGLGFNPFNPAMVGYVALLISFPREMTSWHLPSTVTGETLGLIDSIRFSFTGAVPEQWDSLTGATPLDHVRTQLGLEISMSEITSSPLFGSLAGAGWEWIALGWLLGGFWMLYKHTIRWHIPVSMLGSLTLISLLFYLINPESNPSPLFHLLSGASLIGAFFIATDPVSAATTNLGRIIYGAFIGLMIYVIRTWGGYPDAVAFAVLLANICVPLIDYYTQPKAYGEEK